MSFLVKCSAIMGAGRMVAVDGEDIKRGGKRLLARKTVEIFQRY
jgi:ribosome-associated protein YbcJ (S4-like RNA binding protein)